MSELSRDKTRELSYLVTSGLGYCCEYFFFDCFKKVGTTLIATRLGCSPSTVSHHRKAFRLGQLECAKCEGCLKERLAKK